MIDTLQYIKHTTVPHVSHSHWLHYQSETEQLKHDLTLRHDIEDHRPSKTQTRMNKSSTYCPKHIHGSWLQDYSFCPLAVVVLEHVLLRLLYGLVSLSTEQTEQKNDYHHLSGRKLQDLIVNAVHIGSKLQ